MSPLHYFNSLTAGIDPVSKKALPDEHLCRSGEFLAQLRNLLKMLPTANSLDTQPKQIDTKNDLKFEEKLRAMRSRISKEIGKPAFVVFSNKTLDELLLKKPITVNKLYSVYGFGENKISQYGEEIVCIFSGKEPKSVSHPEKEALLPEISQPASEMKTSEKLISGKGISHLAEMIETKTNNCVVRNIINTLKASEPNSVFIELLEDYLIECKEIARIKNQADAHELIKFFEEVIQTLNKENNPTNQLTKAIPHIESSIREMEERLSTLKSPIDTKRDKIIKFLQRDLPLCKCGEVMHVRESVNGYFYSCSLFPKCYGKKQLTKEQNKIVYSM